MKAIGAVLVAAVLASCASEESPTDLSQRAYVVSRDSDELAVIDLRTLEITARTHTGARSSHMAELSQDLHKVYVSSPDTNEVVVLDARSLAVTQRIGVGMHPTHMSVS